MWTMCDNVVHHHHHLFPVNQHTFVTLHGGYNHLCAGYLFALDASLVLPRDDLLLVTGVKQ